MFIPVDVNVVSRPAERVCVDLLQSGKHDSQRITRMVDDISSLRNTVANLKTTLDRVAKYVKEVSQGETQPHPEMGRRLVEVINAIPKMDPEQFEDMVTADLKDLLMITYLARLIKTQLKINEKLTSL